MIYYIYGFQLNDIISLVVGLWAVKAAARPRSDKYSFGV
jgi:Co/Zn/Cd efflux system component